jgi:hypothetical protein
VLWLLLNEFGRETEKVGIERGKFKVSETNQGGRHGVDHDRCLLFSGIC